MKRFAATMVAGLIAGCCQLAFAQVPSKDGIDWDKARAIFQRAQQGEKLSDEEQAYLEKAKAARQAANQDKPAEKKAEPADKAPDSKTTDPKAADPKPAAIDWDKARKLHERAQQGEKLNDEEQKYYDQARAALQRGEGPDRARPARPAEAKPSLDLKPLSDMSATDRYKGEDGGLYGSGKNTPPEEHLKNALSAAKKIEPLNGEGKPDAKGKIVLISLGMSNTTQEFSEFVRIANGDMVKSPQVLIIDGAQGGMESTRWAQGAKGEGGPRDPWTVLDSRLQAAGATAAQVQVVWIKLARAGPAAQGDYPKHADEQRGHYVTILNKLAEKFPNLRIAYNSSRIYAGNASTSLNPEPYAYEGAFVVRRLIQDQIKGEANLNYDAAKGRVQSPLLLWGPYLWANGEKGRQTDQLMWKPDDFANDGTHPNRSGQQKVAALLLDFFKSDATAKTWFKR